MRTEALQLLAPFLALPADMVQRVHAAVEAIVSDIFPVFSQVNSLSVLLCQYDGHVVLQVEHSSDAMYLQSNTSIEFAGLCWRLHLLWITVIAYGHWGISARSSHLCTDVMASCNRIAVK